MDGFSIAFHMLSHAKIGTSTIQSRATAGVAGTTFIFCCLDRRVPAGRLGRYPRGATRLPHQAGNFVEIMPRLDEHLKRGKAKSS
jgi:molybdenum cofactor biosynthesis protein B